MIRVSSATGYLSTNVPLFLVGLVLVIRSLFGHSLPNENYRQVKTNLRMEMITESCATILPELHVDIEHDEHGVRYD